jgi:hypothetical protein
MGNNAYYNSGWKYIASTASSMYYNQTGAHYWLTAPSGTAGNAITFTQAMTLDASGNLAVGTTSADTTTLRLVPTNSDAVQRTLHIGYNGSMSSGTTGSYISFGNATPSTNQLARIASYYEGGVYQGSLRFYTNANTDGANPTERMRIDSSGNLLVGKTSATANGGDIQVSKGITFPATQSAQSDANTLDDYEEGTWTPTVARTESTYTYSDRTGHYVKIGRQVTVSCYLGITGVTTQGSSYITITGLPFTADIRGVGSIAYNTIAATKNTRSVGIFPSNNFAYLIEDARVDDVMSDTVGLGYLGFTLTYFV